MQTNVCEECPPECEECAGISDCKICRIYFVLYINTCSKSCPDGLHPNWAEKSCKSCKFEEFSLIRDDKEVCFQCKSPCRSCSTDSLNCTSCTLGKFWNGHDCSERCDEGTFPVQEYGMCLNCHFSCKTCVGQFSTDCLSCAEPSFLFQGKCLRYCPDRYFADKDTRSCQNCHFSCSNCEGPLFLDCIDCMETRTFIPKAMSRGECICKERFFDIGQSLCEGKHAFILINH